MIYWQRRLLAEENCRPIFTSGPWHIKQRIDNLSGLSLGIHPTRRIRNWLHSMQIPEDQSFHRVLIPRRKRTALFFRSHRGVIATDTPFIKIVIPFRYLVTRTEGNITFSIYHGLTWKNQSTRGLQLFISWLSITCQTQTRDCHTGVFAVSWCIPGNRNQALWRRAGSRCR
jgi:hypothetical protein